MELLREGRNPSPAQPSLHFQPWESSVYPGEQAKIKVRWTEVHYCQGTHVDRQKKSSGHSVMQLELLLAFRWLSSPSWSTRISHLRWDSLKKQQKLQNMEPCTQQFQVHTQGNATMDSYSIYCHMTSRAESLTSDHRHLQESLFRPSISSTVGLKVQWTHVPNTPKGQRRPLQFQRCLSWLSHESWQ